MSEYWKSTPKYWCKHCSTFVRDTKLERSSHEATPKHQGNLKRFLRDLHRGHEKDEKNKERAKSEVARLNSLVSGAGSAGTASSSSSSLGAATRPSLPKPQATAAQRKQQLAQLAQMGVSIPDEFRPDMAMAGNWQVTSERIVEPDEGEPKPDALALGVRKRQLDEEEDEALEATKRRWGSMYKTHSVEANDGDLDALLNNSARKSKGRAPKIEDAEDIKPETDRTKEEVKEEVIAEDPATGPILGTPEPVGIKTEPPEREDAIPGDIPPLHMKQECEEQVVPGVVFKKRKAKNIRQK